MSTRGKCCMVEAWFCEAPANAPGSVATRCFACGDPVCRECSIVTPYHHYGRKRICFGCVRDHELVDDREMSVEDIRATLGAGVVR